MTGSHRSGAKDDDEKGKSLLKVSIFPDKNAKLGNKNALLDMERIKQRLGKQNTLDHVLERDIDEQEQELADDADAFSKTSSELDVDITLRLKLSTSNNSIDERICVTSVSDFDVEQSDDVFDPEDPLNGQTVFEIVSTDTLKDRHSNYVIYRILLTKSSIVNRNPVVIDRRFSDFEQLHNDLTKQYAQHMEQVVFPKKRLFGNFTPRTIAKRSRGFEQFLTHLYSIDEIRFSQVFLEFFYLSDLREAYNLMLDVEYEQAILKFQKVLLIQEKMLCYLNILIGETLCALVSCCKIVEDYDLALKYGKQALKCYVSHEENRFYLPLLQTCIHLCWKLGEDKETLEATLQKHKRESGEIPSLLSVVHSAVLI